jgi:hypothetical protein
MDDGSTFALVLLRGGRATEDRAQASPRGRAHLRVVRGGTSDLQAAFEETESAAFKVRREIDERITRALDDLLGTRAREPGPG